jgi:hypothetical protein
MIFSIRFDILQKQNFHAYDKITWVDYDGNFNDGDLLEVRMKHNDFHTLKVFPR